MLIKLSRQNENLYKVQKRKIYNVSEQKQCAVLYSRVVLSYARTPVEFSISPNHLGLFSWFKCGRRRQLRSDSWFCSPNFKTSGRRGSVVVGSLLADSEEGPLLHLGSSLAMHLCAA